MNVRTGSALSVRTVAERLADDMGADRGLLWLGAVLHCETDEDLLAPETDRLELLIRGVPLQRLARSSAIQGVLNE